MRIPACFISAAVDGTESQQVISNLSTNLPANAPTFSGRELRAAPDAIISLGKVIPGNGLNRAYVESYPEYPHLHSEWRWRQVQNRITRRMSKYYAERERENIYILPTHLFLDTFDGYYHLPFVATKTDYLLSNAVHPNEYGDEQVAAPIYTHIYKLLIGELP